jgi:ferredoxin
MPTVRFRGRDIDCEHGATLREVLKEAGETPHNGRADALNCRGHGTCGTCAVEIRGIATDPDAGDGGGGDGDGDAAGDPDRATGGDPADAAGRSPPVSQPGAIERRRLSFPPHDADAGLRLACQTRVEGDIEVVKHPGFWGQHVDG